MEARMPTAPAPQQEKPLGEVCAPLAAAPEKLGTNEDPAQSK